MLEKQALDLSADRRRFTCVVRGRRDLVEPLLQGLQQEKGWDVDARLLMYAAGLELGSGLARETANGACAPLPSLGSGWV